MNTSYPKGSRPNNQTRKVAAPISLDDLVEEDKVVERIELNKRLNSSQNLNDDNDNEDEDELDKFMAEMVGEQQQTKGLKKVKIDPTVLDEGSEGELDDEKLQQIEKTALEQQNVDNLKADVEAAIAGVNSPANKTIKRLNQLGSRSVTYKPFKKDFYQEVPELALMSKEETNELRMSLENIKVVGKSCPKPVTCWAHCGLSKKVMEVLKKSNYLSPTPIQAQAIPAIMSGRDVIGIAKTGCGKTMSFLLPMFRHILAQPKLERNDGPIAVVITPTRELATQICDDAQKFTRVLGLRVVAVYGGPNISEQIGMLKPGADIVVCTPGRMIEILTVNSGRVTNLNRCTYLVLDEADRLFDMGFEKQIRSIVDLIRPDRQTVMFSATFPKILEAHARKILTEPIAIQVGGRSIVCKDVSQTVEIIEEHDKFLRLLEIFRKHVDNENSAIVFVSKQGKADSLLEDIMQAYDANCLVLHGGIDKDDRISTFSSFKRGHAKVLVATSVAARGLDVKNCICVVNYDCPNHYEDYVHRCGRTGRAGNKGYAYTFITPDQGQHAADIIKALELSGNPVPAELQNLWDTFKTEAEKTGKKIWSSSGFSGRGFKFDEAEAQLVNEKKKHQKKSLGMQNSSDEEDDAGDASKDTGKDIATLESEIRNLTGSKKDATKPVVRVIGAGAHKNDNINSTTTKQPQPTTTATKQATCLQNGGVASTSDGSQVSGQVLSKLDLVRQRAAMLCLKKGIEAPNEPAARPSDQPRAVEMRARTNQAGAVPQSISHKVTDPSDSSAPVPVPNPSSHERLEMQMEINDFHQQVRRRLTSKDALAEVSEQCEVGITVRGKFFPQGDTPTEPKLYLAIEGTSQANLEEAHKALLLVVKDEYNKMNVQSAKSGRFRVV
uniref:Probable ATP-dependent RNA helicase DDX46 n=2 Tax=Aceria tosichella TaxID=561515 RepID=A0A6G1SM19_9ACAR